MPKSKAKKLVGVSKGEYKGNALAVFGEEGGRFSFQFGSAKAAQLLGACAASGIAPVVRLVMEIAGEKLDAKAVEQIEGDLEKLEASKPKTASRKAS